MSIDWNELLLNSTIIQGIISLIIVGVSAYQWATLGHIDADLKTILISVLAFWIGGKLQQAKASIGR